MKTILGWFLCLLGRHDFTVIKAHLPPSGRADHMGCTRCSRQWAVLFEYDGADGRALSWRKARRFYARYGYNPDGIAVPKGEAYWGSE